MSPADVLILLVVLASLAAAIGAVLFAGTLQERLTWAQVDRDTAQDDLRLVETERDRLKADLAEAMRFTEVLAGSTDGTVIARSDRVEARRFLARRYVRETAQ